MSQSMNRAFRRGQRDSKRNIALRIASLENDNNQLAVNLMRTMAICECLSRIVIDHGIVSKEDYQSTLHDCAKLFNLVPSGDIAKDPKSAEEMAKHAEEIEKELQNTITEEAEAEKEGDPRPESEVANTDVPTATVEEPKTDKAAS